MSSTLPRLLEAVFHPHPVLRRRRNFCQHAIALDRWRFGQPCSSGLPPQISRSSFPIHEHRHPLFRDAPRARRFVSAIRLSLHHLGKPAAQRCLTSFAQASQTSPAVARLLDFAHSRAASPATASMRRVPAAIASSFTIRNGPISPVDLTCVPPQSSIE